jgi:hypothetical protein
VTRSGSGSVVLLKSRLRLPRARKSSNGKVKGAVAPSDAVLAEALSNESVPQPGANGTLKGIPKGHRAGELEPGSGKKLQRNVEEALNRAEDSPSPGGGEGGD